jgi:hypothetical protein
VIGYDVARRSVKTAANEQYGKGKRTADGASAARRVP